MNHPFRGKASHYSSTVDSELELTFALSAIETDFRFCDSSVANSRRVVRLSFRPECDDGIDFGGTARGNEAGNE